MLLLTRSLYDTRSVNLYGFSRRDSLAESVIKRILSVNFRCQSPARCGVHLTSLGDRPCSIGGANETAGTIMEMSVTPPDLWVLA